MAANKPKTKVKPRVAVIVDESGNWAAGGASGMPDADAIQQALDADGTIDGSYRVWWVSLELPVPQHREITAAAEPGAFVDEEEEEGE